MADLPSGTVTFLFTDIKGSTKLWQAHPDAMKAAVARHDALLRTSVTDHGGTIVKHTGDGIYAVFPTSSSAVGSAVQAQAALAAEAWVEVPPLRVRMGVHTGQAEEREGDYFGPAVNRAARLMMAGHGGQVLLSLAAEELCRDDLPDGVTLRDLGEHRLKDLSRPERVFQLVAPGLGTEFPPLNTLEGAPNNLPLQLTSFVGREKELGEAKGLLERARLLTLTGSGGCGKSRLSLQVAADALESFTDGAWLAELAPLSDPGLVVGAVASALGVRENPGQPIRDTLLEHLRTKSLLLILDNCEHLLDECARLADALLRACPDLKILASSREDLGIAGEVTYRIPSLSLPDLDRLPPPERLTQYDAVRLFIERARAAQPSFRVNNVNAPAVAQVCHRLDGIPLAIELAAARVRALPVEGIARRLDDRFRLLTGGSRTALPRQQTLRALIDWSYDLLDGPEKLLLRRLSVFVDGWTLEAAEAVCPGDGVEEWEVLDLLARLVDKSLVQTEETAGGLRYRLLETVRQYARDRLIESSEGEGVRDRHRDYFLRFAEEWSEGMTLLEWMDRIEADHGNALSALDWCGREGFLREELRFAYALSNYWNQRSVSEGRERMEQILSRIPPEDTSPEAGAVLSQAGRLAGAMDDYAPALRWLERGAGIFRDLGDEDNLAQSLNSLGVVQKMNGNYEEARATLEEGLEIRRSLGHEWGIAASCVNLADLAIGLGQFEAARSLLEEAHRRFREVGEETGVCVVMNNLSIIELLSGSNEDANRYARLGLEINERLKRRGGICYCHRLIGMAAIRRGEGEVAPPHLRKAMWLAEEEGVRSLCLDVVETVAEWAAGRGRLAEAATLLGATSALRGDGERKPPAWEADYQALEGRVRQGLGDVPMEAALEAGAAMIWEEAQKYAFALLEA